MSEEQDRGQTSPWSEAAAIATILVLSFGLALLASDWNASRGLFEYHNAKQEQGRTQDRYCYPALHSNAGSPTSVGNKSAASDDEKKRYDLCQQWRMAKAAEAEATDSGRQVVLGGFSVVLLILATWAAWLAARYTKKTITITRQQLTETQRAFVFLDGFRATMEESGSVTFVGQLVNSGNTPTQKMVSHVSSSSMPSDLPEDFGYPDIPGRYPLSPLLIGPNGRIDTVGIRLPPDRVAFMQQGMTRTYIWGWVEYDDTFDSTPRHRTEFCFEVFLPPEISEATPWRLQMYGPHNGHDDTCFKSTKPYPF